MREAPTRTKRAATLTMRLTQATKDALDATAEAEGRSVSQVAERLLDSAVAGQAEMDARLGGGGVALTLLAMADFAEWVRADPMLGDPERKLEARDALLAGWLRMIGTALPYTPDSPEGSRLKAVTAGARAAMAKFLDEMRAEREAGTFTEEEMAWTAGNVRATNALSPEYGRSWALFELLIEYRYASGADAIGYTAMIVGQLNSAPASLSRLSPSPAALAEILQERMDAYEAYMMPRRAAQRRGRELADGQTLAEPTI